MSSGADKAVAIIGGTFDPVHYGHLRAALEVRETLGLKQIRFMPAGRPPHREEPVSEARHRLEMLRLAIGGTSEFMIDTRELERPGHSYMVDTLSDFRAEIRSTPLILVIGQDSANSLDTWHRWQDILGLASLVVMSRPGDQETYAPELGGLVATARVDSCGQLLARPAGAVLKVNVTRLSISSSGIRRIVRAGKSPRFLLPAAVASYVEAHGLYSGERVSRGPGGS